ncbi:MAG: helix-turn-helix domain-containing protein [ANME-2 cluster archaeon]|nr:helix-turn-helix domain-containing protein [ANME-2 cluster archaeon]
MIVFVNNNPGINVQPYEKILSQQIENLPPSAKLVFKVLEYSGSLTQKEIVRESYLPPRTVRYALSRLKNEGFLEERFYFKDARQSLYGIKEYMSENLAMPQEVLAI